MFNLDTPEDLITLTEDFKDFRRCRDWKDIMEVVDRLDTSRETERLGKIGRRTFARAGEIVTEDVYFVQGHFRLHQGDHICNWFGTEHVRIDEDGEEGNAWIDVEDTYIDIDGRRYHIQ